MVVLGGRIILDDGLWTILEIVTIAEEKKRERSF
jgi:hypothetical protein